jgi:hypothetical protein
MTVKIGDVAFDFSLTEDELEALGVEKPMDESPISKEPEEDAPLKKERKSRPAPAKASLRKPEYAEPAGGGFGMVLLFLILAAGAFFAGLSIRHNKDTGESLFAAMGNKQEAKPEAKKEAPAAVETPPAE